MKRQISDEIFGAKIGWPQREIEANFSHKPTRDANNHSFLARIREKKSRGRDPNFPRRAGRAA